MKSLEHQCLDFWRSKPADEAYNWSSLRDCALAQFAKAVGAQPGPYSEEFTDASGAIHTWPDQLSQAAYWDVSITDNDRASTTFGAAAGRLEKRLQP